MSERVDQERVRELRRLEAARADADLRRVASGDGALSLAIGDTLRELFEPGRLGKLAFAREKDYLRERLGVPARTGYQFLRLSRETLGKDLLRRAVLCGALTPNKALAIARVCTVEMESAWVEFALHASYAEIVKRVAESGGESGEDDWQGARLLVGMNEAERTAYEGAVEMARDLLGPGTPNWIAQETIAWEWLGGHSEVLLAEEGEEREEKPVADPDPKAMEAWKKTREEVSQELRALEEAARLVEEGPDPFCVTPEALDARARRLARTRERLTEPLGKLLLAFKEAGHWSALGFDGFTEYAQDRLGMAARTLRERIWLARKLAKLPETREALRRGDLSYAKALLVAKGAKPKDEAARVRKAIVQPAEKVEREAEAEEERRDRALGVKRLWGPAEAMEAVKESIRSVQKLLLAQDPPRPANDGAALAVTGVYFMETWKGESKRKRLPRSRRAVILRKAGLCQVPGCTLGVAAVHHMKYRSACGGEELTNKIGVCSYHHHLIHAGVIRVWGLAGERLVWEFREWEDRTRIREVWRTDGPDDTRRVDPDEDTTADAVRDIARCGWGSGEPGAGGLGGGVLHSPLAVAAGGGR